MVAPEETEALARLARLSLSDAERETFPGQLARILAYIDTLAQVDVDGVEEYVGDQDALALRDDVVGPMLNAEEALAGAPATRDGHVVVPKFKED